MIKVFSYDQYSESALDLAEALGAGALNTPPDTGDTIVCWGVCHNAEGYYDTHRVLNKPEYVRLAANKLKCFEVLQHRGITPSFYRKKEAVTRVCEMMMSAGTEFTLFCRHKLTGMDGEGIEVVKNSLDIPDAKLYTMGIPDIAREYRIHVVGGKVIDWRQKKPKMSADPNNPVKTTSNGFVFSNNDVITPSSDSQSKACQAVCDLGLDFGGVDVVEDTQGRGFVLEVNTASWIGELSVKRYRKALKELCA